MKTLLFICGPNGIGKTAICNEIVRKLPGSAYVDSDSCRLMNPFVINDYTILTIAKNISDLIINYFDCPIIDTVIFSYGFHGRRREVFETVMKVVAEKEHTFIPFLLTCSEEENIRRMDINNRSIERKKHAIEVSRKAFDDILYPRIDITDFSVSEAAENIIDKVRQYRIC